MAGYFIRNLVYIMSQQGQGLLVLKVYVKLAFLHSLQCVVDWKAIATDTDQGQTRKLAHLEENIYL